MPPAWECWQLWKGCFPPPCLCALQDWWNASTVGEYWRLWNMPVHKWLLRHVYYPALRMGLSRWEGEQSFSTGSRWQGYLFVLHVGGSQALCKGLSR